MTKRERNIKNIPEYLEGVKSTREQNNTTAFFCGGHPSYLLFIYYFLSPRDCVWLLAAALHAGAIKLALLDIYVRLKGGTEHHHDNGGRCCLLLYLQAGN
jgi:hypothetical protein